MVGEEAPSRVRTLMTRYAAPAEHAPSGVCSSSFMFASKRARYTKAKNRDASGDVRVKEPAQGRQQVSSGYAQESGGPAPWPPHPPASEPQEPPASAQAGSASAGDGKQTSSFRQIPARQHGPKDRAQSPKTTHATAQVLETSAWYWARALVRMAADGHLPAPGKQKLPSPTATQSESVVQ